MREAILYYKLTKVSIVSDKMKKKLLQKQVIIIGSIDLDSGINSYQTGVA